MELEMKIDNGYVKRTKPRSIEFGKESLRSVLVRERRIENIPIKGEFEELGVDLALMSRE
jgi:DNA-directed RNA polymerase beta' subunit